MIYSITIYYYNILIYLSLLLSPFNRINNSVLTLLLHSRSLSPLFCAKLSISSINIILGFRNFANLYNPLINLALSPTYFDIKSLLDILKNVELPASVANAFAK